MRLHGGEKCSFNCIRLRKVNDNKDVATELMLKCRVSKKMATVEEDKKKRKKQSGQVAMHQLHPHEWMTRRRNEERRRKRKAMTREIHIEYGIDIERE